MSSPHPLRSIIIFIAAISVVFYLLGKRKSTATKIKEREFALFNSTYIKGRLVAIGFSLDISSFKVDNNPHQFIFAPSISEEGAFFNANTEKGDSIIKPANSKQVFVKGKEGSYVYRFNAAE